MSFTDQSTALLAACGGDTVKIFDVTVDAGDPCTLSYTPTPGSHVNSVKWNHTNLVVASAGEDKKITLWQKNGQCMGTVPLSGNDIVDNINESISTISFSNKGSRYLCSGGSAHVVRIWDLQRKLCIKRLHGHSDTITGIMYNCKDEHLASISLKGDLILHNLASGSRAELKDPSGQVLRVLDYSRLSRHVLVTAGDDGSVHLWDTTGRSPKISWPKQHSAPTTGVCFLPSSDKIIASVGLDKKLYTFDSGTRRPTSCAPYETPFSSLAFKDDSYILAAGTNSGHVVFYDVRGKPQPFTILRAFNSSEAVTSLCWQRSKPVIVNEKNCTAETALLGGTGEDSVLMPDPLPSAAALSFSSATTVASSRSSLTATSSGSMSTMSHLSTAEETPVRSHLWPGGSLSKLQAPRTNYNFKDDMDVFSPLVDVQPITPSLGNWWDDNDEAKNDSIANEKKPTFFPSSIRRFPYSEGDTEPHPISDWRSDSTSRQLAATPVASSKGESSSTSTPTPTPPEASGGIALPDKLTNRRQPVSSWSRFLPTDPVSSGSVSAGLQDSSAPTSYSANISLTSPSLTSSNLQGKVTLNHDNLPRFSESSSSFHFSSVSTSLGSKALAGQPNLDFPVSILPVLPRKFSTYAERMSTASSFADGTSSAVGSPKSKKTGAETREELVNSLLSRQDSLAAIATGSLPAINGMMSQPQQGMPGSVDQLQGASSFSLQLVQRTLEETLVPVRKSIHDDVRNLHIELLRQFHMHEMEMSSLLNLVLEKQDELMKEVQSLRRENQQLRQLL